MNKDKFKEIIEEFGLLYGDWEDDLIKYIKDFLDKFHNINSNHIELGCYEEYEDFDDKMNVIYWFILSKFNEMNLINYGTSPRLCWLEPLGLEFVEFIKKHNDDELLKIIFENEN